MLSAKARLRQTGNNTVATLAVTLIGNVVELLHWKIACLGLRLIQSKANSALGTIEEQWNHVTRGL